MKMIEEINKEKKELKEKLNVLEKEKKELETKMNNVNNQLSHAVNVKKNPEKLKIYEKVKNTEFKVENEETEKNNFDKESFDEGGLMMICRLDSVTAQRYNVLEQGGSLRHTQDLT